MHHVLLVPVILQLGATSRSVVGPPFCIEEEQGYHAGWEFAEFHTPSILEFCSHAAGGHLMDFWIENAEEFDTFGAGAEVLEFWQESIAELGTWKSGSESQQDGCNC